jgi:predicted nucleic acid-binding protein
VSVVVSDTSPIRSLAHLGLLDVLPGLFGSVLVPPAVAVDLTVPVHGFAPLDFSALPFVEVRQPINDGLVKSLSTRVHAGESEALALAVEVRPEAILIDEKTDRSVAKELGLNPLGVLGVLVRATRARLVDLVAPLITVLRQDLDFRVSANVERRILELAGE